MNVKVLPLLNSILVVFTLAACAGSAQAATAEKSQAKGAWGLVLFVALAIFFWWWLRRSDTQATPNIYASKAHQAESVANLPTTPAKVSPPVIAHADRSPIAAKSESAKLAQVVEKSTATAVLTEVAPLVTPTPVAVAENIAATSDVIIEDPVRSKQMTTKPMTDKQKKAQKKNAAGEDDFIIVEGIGPKINRVLHEAGIKTYAALGAASVDALRQILASNNLQLHDPSTWPEQSALAATDQWDELERLQSTLSGGKRK